MSLESATPTDDDAICTLAGAAVAANTRIATGVCPAGDIGARAPMLDADAALNEEGLAAGLPDATDEGPRSALVSRGSRLPLDGDVSSFPPDRSANRRS
ncbi:MAG: hypothetical protein AAFX50_18895 [Acidobacteriota bacterium]